MNTLKQAHVAILAAVRAEFGDVLRTVEAYAPESLADVATPALLLELEEWDEGEDIGDGRTPLRCQFVAHCILSFQTEAARLEVREFGLRMQQLLRFNRWGLGADVDSPSQISGMPGQFRPGKDGYETWCVSWEQTLYLGVSVWAGAGVVPTDIRVAVNGGEHIPLVP